MKKPFPVERLKSAFLAVRPRISETQMSMLRAHYLYRVISMKRMARFADYNYYGVANLQYGKLGALIAEQLGFVSDGKISTIASGWEEDSLGHFQRKLDDSVVKALEKTGWFKQVATERLAPLPKGFRDIPEETE